MTRSEDHIELSTRDGTELFRECIGYESGIKLLQYYVTQNTLTFCGPATISMILNAIGLERPESEDHAPYRLFHQNHVFNGPASQILDRQSVEREGMDLRTLSQVLERYGLQVGRYHAVEHSVSAFRSCLLRDLSEPNRYVAVNYHRQIVGQKGGGHISPIGGVHVASDRALILDVSRYRYPALWVSVDTIYAAMLPVDQTANISRGFLSISRP